MDTGVQPFLGLVFYLSPDSTFEAEMDQALSSPGTNGVWVNLQAGNYYITHPLNVRTSTHFYVPHKGLALFNWKPGYPKKEGSR